jgi:hypothetical protein
VGLVCILLDVLGLDTGTYTLSPTLNCGADVGEVEVEEGRDTTVPETSKQGMWISGQFTKGAHVSSPFVIAVLWTAMSSSSEEAEETGAVVDRERVLDLVLKRMAVWVWGRVDGDIWKDVWRFRG